MKIRIAILGATSHIAKGLICNFTQSKEYKLFLFARSTGKARDFLRINGIKGNVNFVRFDDFPRKEYDFIINCIGIGTPNKVRDNPSLVFGITEEYDNMVLAYLSKFVKSGYINFSSGAVYGSSFKKAVGDLSSREILINNISPQEYYGIAKINSEAKHRAQKNLHIVDIRVFSYFSRFIDLNAGYFLTDLIGSIKKGSEFITNSCDFIRDYLHPSDLFNLIELTIEKKPFNAAIDAYSQAPVSKFELLDYFSKTYGLKYRIENKLNFVCPTGVKNVYCSNSRKAAELGYIPNYSSINTVKEEVFFILKK